jgi:hypothetical protein
MAEIDVTRPRRDDRDVLVERTGFRLSWGGIFAGFVVATALQMVFSTLGAAIGLTAFDPGQGDSARSLGIGVLVWFAVSAIISMWVGGTTTGRLAGVLTRGDGMLHGIVMWSLSLLRGERAGRGGRRGRGRREHHLEGAVGRAAADGPLRRGRRRRGGDHGARVAGGAGSERAGTLEVDRTGCYSCPVHFVFPGR